MPLLRRWQDGTDCKPPPCSFSAAAALLLGCPAALGDPQRFTTAQSSTAPSCDAPALLTTHCASCHGGAAPASGVAIDSAAAIDALRGKAAKGGPGVLVDPASSLHSVVYTKVTTLTFGTVMPPSGALDATDAACIKGWLEGAH